MESWKPLLQAAVAETSIAEVARRLGVARSSLSLLLHDRYPGGTEKMAKRIFDALGRKCPVYGDHCDARACAGRRAAPMPTSSPYALRRWRECQNCKEN